MSDNSITTMLMHLKRTLFDSHPMAQRVNLLGKKMIVTGAGMGSIGYETAMTLAEWGATVIVTTRSKTDQIRNKMLQELTQKGVIANLDAHPLDLTDAESVRIFVEWYRQAHGDRLDVLINNAGVHADLMNQWTEPNLTRDGFEVHWRTNYLGPMQLTLLLLPLIQKTGRQSGDARVVFVSSHLHTRARNADLFGPTRPYNSWNAYGASKLALVHAAFEIQRRFVKDNIRGIVLHPGSISTNIAHKGLESNKLVQKLRDIFVKLESWVLLTPVEGAQTTIMCATAPTAKGGTYYDRLEIGSVNPEAFDSEVSSRLWQKTEKWVEALSAQRVEETA
ncbi:MAG TPA: SDR family NAD(P)-dependent oxidoreductase [Pseudomonadales bacterium]|nr:SDR family NAD(P)-dependent oxidoreductase [Pseudomonadales bacterium]